MDSAVQNKRPDLASYALLGVLLAMLTASFYPEWYRCSESWFFGGSNALYSPGPLVPILVLLMLSARLRRLKPTPELGSEDLFHTAYMRVVHPVVVRAVSLWYSFRGVHKNGEEIGQLAYDKRAIAAWAVWLAGAGAAAAALYYGRQAALGDPGRVLKSISHVLFAVQITLFGAAVAYVGWRLCRADEKAQRSARSPVQAILGALVLVLALGAHFGGVRGTMWQLSIIAFTGCLIGLVWMFHGWRVVRVLIFPLAFMVLTLPMHWVEAQIGLPAQIFATKYSVAVMRFLGLNVEIIGRTAFDVIRAGEHINFDVDAPCSGLKSLVALTAVSATYGYLTQKTTLKMLIVMACGPFLAIITNIARLVAVGVTAHLFTRSSAMWVHDHALPIYVLAVLLLMLIDKLLNSKWLKIEDF
jgi:exosortase